MASNGFLPPAGGGGGVAETETGSAFGSRSGSGRDHEYFGWVYHLGVNSIGHEYCHLRFLILRGRYVFMYKRDPHANPGIEPIRKGVISHTLMVEELGRRTANTEKALYVLRFYNRLDHAKKGEIACGSPADARKWMEAFAQAKQQAEFDLLRGGSRHKLNKDEINLDGHRPRVRHYAKKLIKIGKGPEMLLRQTSDIGNVKMDSYSNDDDVKETHEWQCVRTVNGIRILENVGDSKGAKTFILKAVGVIQADVDTVFEVILNLDRHKRYEWDMLTGDLEQVDSLHGHYDVVYGKYEPKHLSWWKSKKDFVFSRQWFRAQDGSYTILQLPAVDKKKPPESGYKRIKLNPSTWEIRQLHRNESSNAKSIVSHMVEIHPKAWERWRRNYNSKFEKSIPYALLCQVTGLREYFAANTTLTSDSPSTIIEPRLSDVERSPAEFEESDIKDEFYDAIADGEALEDEDSDSDDVEVPKSGKLKLKNVSWAIASLVLRRSRASIEKSELDASFPLIAIDPSLFHGSMSQGKGKMGTNCWTSPSGQDFMIRGKTYLEDRSKIAGGDPLLKLIAVDWFKSENSFDKVALHPKSLVQTEAAKKLPFILIINLQIPAKPNYNLVMYYAAERPIHSKSLLEKFVEGSDVFRDARFKLIPSIVEGYWMVKRAVGTKACLLGKAVTINYLRQNNFLEIDVDIGSSSVARSIISLVLGYITSIVVDLAILIEAKEENELPEYILGTVRLNRVTLESAVPI